MNDELESRIQRERDSEWDLSGKPEDVTRFAAVYESIKEAVASRKTAWNLIVISLRSKRENCK